jgi:glutamyl-tRNA synthetase
MTTVRTRIAPSPTGNDLHVGSVVTALMNFAWAKKNKGQFIVRIEDTDRLRLVAGSEERILKTLEDLGLHADESPLKGGPYGPYRQSERLTMYHQYAQELVAKGKAYYCICSSERLEQIRRKNLAEHKLPKYDRYCYYHQDEVKKAIAGGKKYVIRLLVPDKEINFTDLIRGEIKFQGTNIDDQILLKSDGFPTYHLAVVIDDHLMAITHVIRGEEWLPSTPKHLLLYYAFNWSPPLFAHIPLLRNPDKSKLSKRKNPVWVSEYLHQGIFKEALLNYLALMGWSHPAGKEIFSLTEYIKTFSLEDIQTTAPVFDIKKLEWLNGEYIRKTPDSELTNKLYEFYHARYPKALISKTIFLIKERIKKLADYWPLCEFFFHSPTQYEIDIKKYSPLLPKIQQALREIDSWNAEVIGAKMIELAKRENLKNSEFFMLLRVLITGKKISPPLNESMELLGKRECVKRIVVG